MSSPETVRSRTIRWELPVLDPAELAGLSGLEYLRRGLDTDTFRAPIGALMDFRPVRFDEGVAVFEALPAEFHYNPIGSVHGGFAATLLDSALGCSIHTTLKPGFGYTTVELKVNYVRPLKLSTGPVRAEGKVIHVGGRIATSEARLTDPDGRLYAHGTTTCLIFPLDDKRTEDKR
ncbi:hypothetical protein GCM10011611_39260 [Aliidongia dinghuensis]|uniref:Thioesterase domain-containing protein n=1 Tax=Aliidongia dinghuensis TaxID=1867774 RepID=A0A8J3E4R3_9PROT|nr:PaaI family thioesterase [Aliidongia dinghuensis]GGF29362.1 hypothetical protein GCM10011611_39260 [Aliidongia dinghuensis]